MVELHWLSTIIHATVLVSRALELVITKLVEAVLALTRNQPGVPPSAFEVTKILLFVVTDVFETVTAPAVRVAVPIFAFDPDLTTRPKPTVEIVTGAFTTFTLLEVIRTTSDAAVVAAG
jgi:hypothetical protein